jgi:hypothetical protein
MRSRSARVVSVLLAWIALAAAGFFAFHSHQQILTDASTLREADLHAREAADALVDLRVAQQAYVAAGQGVDFWMPKVVSTKDQVSAALTNFRNALKSQAARTELDEAVAAMGEFAEVDKRARDYIHSRQQLMAGDVIFTEGGQLATVAARKVELARIAEHQAFDTAEAALRRQQAYALGGASLFAGLIALMLALSSTSGAPELPAAKLDLSPRMATPRSADLPLRSDAEEGIVSHARPSPSSPKVEPPPPRAVEAAVTPSPRSAVVLTATAELATDMGRVRDSADLERVLGRTADLLDASGLVVWIGAADAAGESLRPVLAHGYTPQALARMPAVPCDADNAAAAAYRTGTLQIVQSRAGSAAKVPGAIVAPILGTEGCIGALSAEINNGGESSEAVQAVAAIVAAQLASILVVASETQSPEVRAASAG